MLSPGGLPCMPLLARSRQVTIPPKFSGGPTRIYAPSPKLEGVRQQRVKAERHQIVSLPTILDSIAVERMGMRVSTR